MSSILLKENRYMESPYRIQDSWSTIQMPFDVSDTSISEEEISEIVKKETLEPEEGKSHDNTF